MRVKTLAVVVLAFVPVSFGQAISISPTCSINYVLPAGWTGTGNAFHFPREAKIIQGYTEPGEALISISSGSQTPSRVPDGRDLLGDLQLYSNGTAEVKILNDAGKLFSVEVEFDWKGTRASYRSVIRYLVACGRTISIQLQYTRNGPNQEQIRRAFSLFADSVAAGRTNIN